MQDSFIKLYRKITEWEWYKDANTARMFFHLLLKAYFKGFRIDGIKIERGSLITSLTHLSQELNMSVQSVRTALKHLQSTGEINIIATHKYSIVIINNYDEYQKPTKYVPENQHTSLSKSTNNQQSVFPINTDKITSDEASLTQKPEKSNTLHLKNQQHNKKDILKKNDYKKREEKHPHGKFENVFLSDYEVNELKRDYPFRYLDKINRLSCYLMSSGRNYDNHYVKLVEWLEADKNKDASEVKTETSKASYDINELEKIV